MDLPVASSVLRRRDRILGGVQFRSLAHVEQEQLRSLGNRAQRWDWVLVEEPFRPDHIRQCEFSGLVRICADPGTTRRDAGVPGRRGLFHSGIHNCDIGRGVTISSVSYLANYVVRDGAVLHRIDRLTYHPRDPNEPAHMLGWAAVANENGSRRVPLVPGLLPADTWLISRFPECSETAQALALPTSAFPWPIHGGFGTIGDEAVIQSVSIISRVQAGPGARIEAAHLVSNALLCSSVEQPATISDGAVVEDAVLGPASMIRGNVIARRVYVGSHASLLDGARVTDVVLGDNSTIAGAEVSNCHLSPFHGQHHQSSFLIAAHLEGQDNIAAGAVLGSNHNSRAADGELVARRGFWPALRTSVRHSSRFAAFTLLARGDYSYEIDLPYPFSLVSRTPGTDQLVVMPAYWWMYNPYALFRNERKFRLRDERQAPQQPLEYRFMAPDTADAVLRARERLSALAVAEMATTREQAISWLETGDASESALSDPDVEGSKVPALVTKSGRAFRAYREMLVYYSGGCIVEASTSTSTPILELSESLGRRNEEWVLAGGQPTQRSVATRIAAGLCSGAFTSWDQVHAEWKTAWEEYDAHRLGHAMYVADVLNGGAPVTAEQLAALLEESIEVRSETTRRARAVRRKDAEDPFRRATLDDERGRQTDRPHADEDSVCSALEAETDAYCAKARRVAALLRRHAGEC